MRIPRSPPEQTSWFGSHPPPPTTMQPALAAEADAGAFARLWTGFMSARVLIALAMLVFHLLPGGERRASPLALGLCAAYLAVTAVVRLLARPCGPGRPFDAQWPYTVGADLAFIVLLELQPAVNIDYLPLLGLPVLMAAIMGTRAMTLGTAALAALALLGASAWRANAASWADSSGIVQAGLIGAGMLLLSLLIHQLAARLAREETLVRRSRIETRTQLLVNNLVIEAMSDGVLVVDVNYAVRVANPAAHLMLGIDPGATPHPFSLLDNLAWMQLAQAARLTFTGGPVNALEVTLHHEDRRSSHLQVRTRRTPAVDEGAGSLCVMFLQDLRETEARLRTEKLAAMGRMSAAVAHEIRNPLAAISQANALLEEDLTAPAQQRLAGMVRQNAERLGNIVEDVLNIARVQDAAGTPEQPSLDLDAQIRDFCLEWQEQHGEGARLLVDLQAPERQVQFAHEHLRRVLVNLLDNAARYASPMVGAIQVSTRPVRYGPVTLMIWSDGPPLEESVRRHLFEPFFSSEARSSGLGLFICRELCERHDAVIGYERMTRQQDGRAVDGNEFFVHFRRAYEPPQTQTQTQPPPLENTPS